MTYRHTQTGYLLIVAYTVVILVMAILTVMSKFSPLLVAGLLLLLLALRTFATLTVTVTGARLEVQYGIAVVRKRFALSDIQDHRPVRNPWYYGLGIRYTPRGWLFAVSGRSAVELEMRDGRHYRIGTDEPGRLATALDEARPQALPAAAGTGVD